MISIKDLPPNVHFAEDVVAALRALAEQAAATGVYLMVDAAVSRLHAPAIATLAQLCTAQLTIPSGERHKTLDTAATMWQFLLAKGADRKALVLAVGGGVVTDMSAFVASTYMRGVRFVLCPTTLLSQVDASMGGKTGIDFAGGKNLVGTFAEPEAVVISPTWLDTLPPRELASGYAEVLKHGLIADAAYWHRCKARLPLPQDVAEIVRHSVAIKYAVVQADPREAGLRKVLNFGHTLGHAIESHGLTLAEPLLHGEAIALGMWLEAQLSVQHAQLPLSAFEDIAESLRQLGYLRATATIPPLSQLLPYLFMDKKNSGGSLRFSLLNEIGTACWDVALAHADLEVAFAKLGLAC